MIYLVMLKQNDGQNEEYVFGFLPMQGPLIKILALQWVKKKIIQSDLVAIEILKPNWCK